MLITFTRNDQREYVCRGEPDTGRTIIQAVHKSQDEALSMLLNAAERIMGRRFICMHSGMGVIYAAEQTRAFSHIKVEKLKHFKARGEA